MTVQKRKTQSIKPLILTDYETWDEAEDDNCKTWHSLTDQHGEVHYLPFSPYTAYMQDSIEAFKECAKLMGRVPNRETDNKGHNFEVSEIFVLLEKLQLIKEIKSGDVY